MSFAISRNAKRCVRQVVCLTLACALACAQTPAPAPQVPGAPAAAAGQQPLGAPPAAVEQLPSDVGGQLARLRPNYVLRPGDQILIRAFEMEEISDRPYRIDGDGFIDLPILGRTKAGGISVENLEANLVEALKKYVKVPQVTLTVVQFSSEPVFFVGAFKSPGIYPISGGRTLVEMMSSIGGLQPTASRRIKITRRKEYGPIPLPNVRTLADGSGTTVEINMAALQTNVNPADDIVLQPFDVISVERAQLVYVMGEVGHVGGFELQERDSMSVIQVLTMAGGLSPAANPKSALILRPIMDTSRRAAIPIDLPRILRGEGADQPLLPNDVLVIGKGKKLSPKDLLVILPIVSTVVSLALTLTH